MNTPSIPRYELFEPPLGEGSYGVVYRARFDGYDERAVKVFKRGLLDFDVLRRELEKLAKAKHVGVVVLYDSDLTGETPYYAMGLHAQKDEQGKWEGRTLEGICGKVEVKEALPLLRQVAEAGAFLHKGLAEPIIHCDLKPSNVLLTGEEPPRVQLCDFGQSRSSAVKTLELSGTPFYASPEQLRRPGESGEGKGFRWDVYSFGVLAYKLLTGRLPRLEEKAKELREEDTARSIIQTDQKALDAEELARLTEGEAVAPWPKELKLGAEEKAVILKCLEIDPEKRFAHLGEVAEEFKKIEEGRRARLRRNVMVALGGLALVAAFAAALAVTGERRARASEEVAVAEKSRALSSQYRSAVAAAAAAIDANEPVDALRQLAAAPEALRSWEWRYLAARLGFAPLRISESHLALLNSGTLKGSGLYEAAKKLLAAGEVPGSELEEFVVRGDTAARAFSGGRAGGGLDLQRRVGDEWVSVGLLITAAYGGGGGSRAWISPDESLAMYVGDELKSPALDGNLLSGLPKLQSERAVYLLPVGSRYSLTHLFGVQSVTRSGLVGTRPTAAILGFDVTPAEEDDAAEAVSPQGDADHPRFLLVDARGSGGARLAKLVPESFYGAGSVALLACLNLPEEQRAKFLAWAAEVPDRTKTYTGEPAVRRVVAVNWAKGLKEAVVQQPDGAVEIWDLEAFTKVVDLEMDQAACDIWRYPFGAYDKGAAFSADGSRVVICPYKGDRAAVVSTSTWEVESLLSDSDAMANDWTARPGAGARWGMSPKGTFAWMVSEDPPSGAITFALNRSSDGSMVLTGANRFGAFGWTQDESLFAAYNQFDGSVTVSRGVEKELLTGFSYKGAASEELVQEAGPYLDRLRVGDRLMERDLLQPLLKFDAEVLWVARDFAFVVMVQNGPDPWGDPSSFIEVVRIRGPNDGEGQLLADRVRDWQFALISSTTETPRFSSQVSSSEDYARSVLESRLMRLDYSTTAQELAAIQQEFPADHPAWETVGSTAAPDDSLFLRLARTFVLGSPISSEDARTVQEAFDYTDEELAVVDHSGDERHRKMAVMLGLANRISLNVEEGATGPGVSQILQARTERGLSPIRATFSPVDGRASEVGTLDEEEWMAAFVWACGAASGGDDVALQGWLALLCRAPATSDEHAGSKILNSAVRERRFEVDQAPFWASRLPEAALAALGAKIGSLPDDYAPTIACLTFLNRLSKDGDDDQALFVLNRYGVAELQSEAPSAAAGGVLERLATGWLNRGYQLGYNSLIQQLWESHEFLLQLARSEQLSPEGRSRLSGILATHPDLEYRSEGDAEWTGWRLKVSAS